MDGGRSNILGLLYECLVFNHLLVDSWVPDEPATDSDSVIGARCRENSNLPRRLEQLLGTATTVEGQKCDIDLLASTPNELVLMQMKASLADNTTLQPANLRDYIIAEANHLGQIRQEGDKREVKKLIIITTFPQSPKFSETINKYKSDKYEAEAWLRSGNTDEANIQICLDLFSKIELFQIKIADLQEHAEKALGTLGLLHSEIQNFCSSVYGDLVTLEQPTLGSITEKMKQRVFSYGFHTLCPESIAAILEQEVARSWDEVGLTSPNLVPPLPRRHLVKQLIEEFETSENELNSLGVVVMGNGGSGKSHLLRSSLQIWAPERICCLGPASKDADHCYENALDMAFAHYQHPRSVGLLLDRLRQSMQCCTGKNSPIWIFLPETDRFAAPELDSLLINLSQLLKRRNDVRLAITCRASTWENLIGHFELRPVSLDQLDEADVRNWISKRTKQNFENPDGSERVLKNDYLNALVFDSLARWSSERQVDDIRLLLDDDEEQLASFWSRTKRGICDRIRKHVSEDASVLIKLFDEVFEACQKNGSIQNFKQLPSFSNINSPEYGLRRQFAEIGVIEERGGAYYWALNGYRK